MLELDLRSGGLHQDRRQPDHAGLDARPHVEGASIEGVFVAAELGLRDDHVGLDDIAHVDVVASLLAISEDGERQAGNDAVGKDRHDARFAVRVLARAVDVRVA